MTFNEAIQKIEGGENPLSVLEQTDEEDREKVEKYLESYGD